MGGFTLERGMILLGSLAIVCIVVMVSGCSNNAVVMCQAQLTKLQNRLKQTLQ